MMRKSIIALAAGAFLLSGCNMVVSDEPWFERDEAALKMKPGLWVDADAEDGVECTFDEAADVADWPECADPALVTEDGRFFGYEYDKKEWNEVELIIGAGVPAIMQVKVPEELGMGSDEVPGYFYAAMRPVETDAAGLVTEMTTWLLVCGEMPEQEGAVDLDSVEFKTRKPFEGLTMVGDNCTADDLDALRNAALKSEEIEDDSDTVHWVKNADMSVME